MTRRRAQPPRNLGSTPDRDARFISYHKYPDRPWSLPSLLLKGHRGLFAGNKAAGGWSSPVTSIYCRVYKMYESIPPFPHVLMTCFVTEQPDSWTEESFTSLILNLSFRVRKNYSKPPTHKTEGWDRVKLCNINSRNKSLLLCVRIQVSGNNLSVWITLASRIHRWSTNTTSLTYQTKISA